VSRLKRRCLQRTAVDGDADDRIVAVAAVTRIELDCDADLQNLWCDAE